MTALDDVLMIVGLGLVVAGVALFDWRVAIVLAGVCLAAIAILRAKANA